MKRYDYIPAPDGKTYELVDRHIAETKPIAIIETRDRRVATMIVEALNAREE